jgi:hypothetical protein
MVAGRGFEAEEQGMALPEMKDQVLESLLVHCGGERKDLLSPLSYTTGVKLVFSDIDPDKQSHTHLQHKERKSGIASGQASMVTRAQKGPINISGLQGAGDRLKIRVRGPRKH